MLKSRITTLEYIYFYGLNLHEVIPDNYKFNDILIHNQKYAGMFFAYALDKDPVFRSCFIEDVNIDYVGDAKSYYAHKEYWDKSLRGYDHDVLKMYQGKRRSLEEMLIVCDLFEVDFNQVVFYLVVAWLGWYSNEMSQKPHLIGFLVSNL